MDGEAFCDAIYFLVEIPHILLTLYPCVSNFVTTFVIRRKNKTYTSEQTVQEMITAIGSTYSRRSVLLLFMDEPFNSEAVRFCRTAISPTKYLKLIDLSPAIHATAVVQLLATWNRRHSQHLGLKSLLEQLLMGSL